MIPQAATVERFLCKGWRLVQSITVGFHRKQGTWLAWVCTIFFHYSSWKKIKLVQTYTPSSSQFIPLLMILGLPIHFQSCCTLLWVVNFVLINFEVISALPLRFRCGAVLLLARTTYVFKIRQAQERAKLKSFLLAFEKNTEQVMVINRN